MGPWKPTPENTEALRKFFARQQRAREIDPEAFKPVMVPQYSESQIHRQQIAWEQAGGDE